MSKRSNTVLHVTYTLFVFLLVMFSIHSVIADEVSELSSSAISTDEIEMLSQLPISFAENVGQAPEEIAFLIQSAGYLFGFTYDGFYFIPSEGSTTEESIGTLPVTRMIIEGADPDAAIIGTDLLPGLAHYFIGSDESEWITNVSTYQGIRYADILPGISLSYSGTEGVLKREFILEPGIEPESIVLVYDGIEELELAEDGTLLVHSASGIMSESAPVSYQMKDEIRTDLESSFILLPEHRVSFYVEGYDPSLPLVIDPYLQYSTMLGGGRDDVALDMAVDESGNVYLTGHTISSNFPVHNPLASTINPVYNGSVPKGGTDAFVTMITTNANGNATIQFSTYLGGRSSDMGRGIALDKYQNIYVTGETNSPNFPTYRPIQNGATFKGDVSDAFVTKLQSGGNAFLYSTYIGGSGKDAANSIFVDSYGDAYITGKTQGNNEKKQLPLRYPTTSGAYQTVSAESNGLLSDAFVSRIRDGSSAATLTYSTYLSGSSEDVGKDLVVDASGNIYIVGTTSSPDLVPKSVPGFQKEMSIVNDAFVFKLNPSLDAAKQVVYATYLGGRGYEEGEAITLDSLGQTAYVTGTTTSTDFPTTSSAYQRKKTYPLGGDADIFVTKLNGAGTGLVYSTYLGGSSDEGVFDIALDSIDQAYIAGYTYSNDYPRLDSFKGITSDRDAVVTGLNTAGSDLVLSTNFGGHKEDCAHAVHVSASGDVYVAGHSSSMTFPQMRCDPNCWNEAFPVERWINQTLSSGMPYDGSSLAGDTDAFVMKFSPAEPVFFEIDFNGVLTDSGYYPVIGAAQLNVTFIPEFYPIGSIKNTDITRWTWTFGDGTSYNTTSQVSVEHNYTLPGKYSVQLRACTRGNVCEIEQKYNYVIVEDRNASITANNNPVTIPQVSVLENTSFQMRWTSSIPLPDRIVWTFTGPGGKKHTFKTNSLTLTVPEGLTPPGLYDVMAIPHYYYGPDMDMQEGTPILRDDYLNILKIPTIEFNTPATGVIFMQGPAYAYPDTTVQMRVPDLGYDITRIRWDYGDGTSSGWVTPFSNTTSHKYAKVGEYWPVVTVYNSTIREVSSQRLDSHRVIVFNPVTPEFMWIPETPMVGETVTFIDMSTGEPVSWYWVFDRDGFIPDISTLQNPTSVYPSAGAYIVTLAVEDLAGVTRSVYHNITVIPAGPNLVTLTWDPLRVPIVGTSSHSVVPVLDAPLYGLHTFELTATISNTSVAAFTGRSTPPSWTNEFRVVPVGSAPYKSVHVYGISHDGIPNITSALELGTLEVSGKGSGITQMMFSNPDITYGTVPDTYTVRLQSAQIIVQTSAYPVLPLPNMKGPQADLDGDGLIDDFNGDGEVNAFDVITFFDAYIAGYLTPGSLYDYNRNGRLDLHDIVEFYDAWKVLNALAMMF